MKILMFILIVASVALNSAFFAGCKSLHDVVWGDSCRFAEVPPPAVNDGRRELVEIAERLEIKTEGKSASDLASDIKYKLDRTVDVPPAYEEGKFEKMAKALSAEQQNAMQTYQRFISGLRGRKVLVIERD